MICRNCGKEIPDDVKYCGYCGALQTEEDIKEEDTSVSVEESEPEKSDTEEAVSDQKDNEETQDASDEKDVIDAEVVEKEEPEVKEEKPAEKKVEPVKEKLKEAGSKIADSTEPVIDKGKETAKKINWGEFRVYKDIILKPFEPHAVSNLPLWTGIVIMLLGSWFVFGSFGNGLFVLLFALAGSMIVQYIGERETGEYHVNDAFQQAFCSAVIPFLAMLAAGILFHSGQGNITVLTRRLGLIAALAVFAAVVLAVSIAKSAKKMSAWLLVLILTVMFTAMLYYLSIQYITQINAFLSMF